MRGEVCAELLPPSVFHTIVNICGRGEGQEAKSTCFGQSELDSSRGAGHGVRGEQTSLLPAFLQMWARNHTKTTVIIRFSCFQQLLSHV